jgi:hypothetical protein
MFSRFRGWGTVHPVKGGTRLIGTGLALALFATGDGAAWAGKLDRDACKALKAEQTDLIAGGVKGDMERGPEWAAANLTLERLDEIKRLIEVGEQLEFRCGSGASTVVAKPAKRREIPEEPAKKPSQVTETKRATASPSATSKVAPARKTPKAEHAEAAKPMARSASAAELPPAEPVAAAAATATAKPTVPASVRSAVKPAKLTVPAMAAATPPAATAEALPSPAKPVTGKPVTAKRSPRRPSSSTYVSPGDVNPSFATHYGAGP